MATAKRELSIEARLRDQVSKPLSKIDKALVGFAIGGASALRGLGRALTNVRTLIVGAAAAFGAFRAVQFVRSTAESEAALLRLAETAGDSVENLSDLQGALVITGGDAQGFADDLRTLNQQARQALAGSREVLRGFTDLGITIEDLRSLSPSALFERMAAGLERFTTAQEKEAALGRILPERFQKLLPLLGRGLSEFQRTIQEARAAGATVTREEAEVAIELDKTLRKLGLTIDSVGQALLREFGPEAIAFFEQLSKLIANNRDEIAGIAKAIATGVVQAIGIAIDAVIGLIRVIESIPGVDLLPTPAEIQRQIDQIGKALSALRSPTAFSIGELTPDQQQRFVQVGADQLVQELERDIERLSREGQVLLADQLQAVRDGITAEFTGVVSKFRDDPQGTATVLGVPGPSDVEAMGEAIREAFAGVQEDQVRGEFPSVFGTTTRTGSAAPTNAATAAENLRAQIKDLQAAVALAPGVQSLADRLAEVQAQSAVLELRAARDAGVISAAELEEALRRVNLQLDRAQQKAGVGDFFEGFSRGARESVAAFTDLERVGQDAAQSLIAGGFGALNDELVAGLNHTKRWEDVWDSVGRSILNILQQIIVKLILVRALQGFGSLFGGGGGGGEATTTTTTTPSTTAPLTLGGGGTTAPATLGPSPLGAGTAPAIVLPSSGGTTQNVYINVSAIDSRDARRFILEQGAAIGVVVADQLKTEVPMRQVVQRVVS